MILVAITGSIGCGKTTLAGLVRELGFVVYDVDAWTRQLYKQPDFIKQIVDAFPEAAEEGKINKRKLRNLVFNQAEKLYQLENIVHPFLKRKFLQLIHKNAKNDELFFIDAALILELGWDRYCDLVIVANVDHDTQKQRVMKRDGISAADFEKINNVQMHRDEKIRLADVVIDTDQPLNKLKLELMSLIDGIM